ncbi:MAG TPA: hypothetical protein PKG48_11310 [Bacteroidales bacterium]|mgnify:CR=1 FL=1|nr:hypothetical protein [Bacteroidales bacterium]HPS62003.1 hypothetical protein [Bacteroidales bacterium]
MGIDIKLPIGLMFSILGFILTLFGIFTGSDASMYSRSLGINVNLWSGAGMLVFGLIMLALAIRSRKSKTT